MTPQAIFVAVVLGAEPHAASLYIDFAGATLATGPDNAALDQGSCLSGGTIPPHAIEQADPELIVAEVRALLAPFRVRVWWGERPPAHLPYSTVYAGGTPEGLGLEPSIDGAICSADCGDVAWRDLGFALTGKGFGADPGLAARVIVHEAAHTWGLDHVDDPTAIMSPQLSPDVATWAVVCTPLAGNAACAGDHVGCLDGQQSSRAELLARFGASGVDATPPIVAIVSPADGEVVEAGSEITLEVEVSDDRGGEGWRFSAPGLEWEHIAYDRETSVTLIVPEGDIEFLVEAIDHGLNVATDSVVVHVRHGVAAPVGCGCAAPTGLPWFGSSLIAYGLLLSTAGRKQGRRGAAEPPGPRLQ